MAEDRKARLKALAAKAGRSIGPSQSEADSKTTNRINDEKKENSPSVSINFRNYAPKNVPQQQSSRKEGNDTSKIIRGEAPPATKRSKPDRASPSKPPTSLLEVALQEAEAEVEVTEGSGGDVAAAGDVTALAPKKINWDLKRDAAKQLEKLERKTTLAIVDILRKRLEKEAMDMEKDGVAPLGDDVD